LRERGLINTPEVDTFQEGGKLGTLGNEDDTGTTLNWVPRMNRDLLQGEQPKF